MSSFMSSFINPTSQTQANTKPFQEVDSPLITRFFIPNPVPLFFAFRRNFLAEIFHPDHAEDADDLHVSVPLRKSSKTTPLGNGWNLCNIQLVFCTY